MIRYFGDYVIDTLKTGLLKVAIPSKLNDPFEFSIVPTGQVSQKTAEARIEDSIKGGDVLKQIRTQRGDPELTNEAIISELRSNPKFVDCQKDPENWKDHYKDECLPIADRMMRLLCLSASNITKNGDILMWSHYGHSHSGFRLHFNTDFLDQNGISKDHVKYRDQRPKIDINVGRHDSKYHQQINTSTKTKGKFWKYEKEVRFFIEPKLCVTDQDMDYIAFPPDFLTRIDIGIRADPKVIEELKSILQLDKYKHVELHQTKLSETKYSLDYASIS